MKRLFLAVLIAAVASVPASAATLYVGHGIPGKALGLASNALPVDICVVNGPDLGIPYPIELFSGVEFTPRARSPRCPSTSRAVVTTSRSSSRTRAAPATGPSPSRPRIFLAFNENATAFAHLNEQGIPTLTKYVNDFRPLASDMARLYARHAAAIGDVDVSVKGKGWPVSINGLENPDQEGADLRAGSTYVSISSARGDWRWQGPHQPPLRLEAVLRSPRPRWRAPLTTPTRWASPATTRRPSRCCCRRSQGQLTRAHRRPEGRRLVAPPAFGFSSPVSGRSASVSR